MSATRQRFLAQFLALLLVPGITLLAPARAGSLSNINEVTSIHMSVEPVEQKLHINVTGGNGLSGIVRLALLPVGGTSVVFMDVPFTYPSTGILEWTTDLINFEQWPGFDCVAQAITMAADGSATYSSPWGLRMRRYPLSQLAGVPLPAGGSTSLAMPGTTSPLFPVTWTAIEGRALSGVGFECLVFATAAPGIEGVLPVN
jgi:hypothetical protein